jgi:hypothetical protein
MFSISESYPLFASQRGGHGGESAREKRKEVSIKKLKRKEVYKDKLQGGKSWFSC